MTLASGTDGIRAVPLDDLQVSNTGSQAERRKHFDKAAIDELADSIKTLGLLSPIIARRVNGCFEVVAGERRLMAAKKAGLSAISVDVRTLTDEQVLKIQLVENLQREDLHELAEAEGYEALQKLGYAAEEIADEVGKSKGYVYSRMKLIALCKASRTAFYDKRLTASTALLLARISVESTQLEALKALTCNRWNGKPLDNPMSFREAAEIVRNDYMTNLGEAGFPTEDATLVPAAGGCYACPKRTGNQAELFDDVKNGNVCTDPICFKAKREANAIRVIAKAKETGQTVVTGKEVKKIFPHGIHNIQGGYHRLEDTCYDDAKRRTYGQLLGKNFQPTLVQDPESGKLIKVAPPEAIKGAFKAKGVKNSGSSGRSFNTEADKKARAKRQAEEAYRAAVLHQIFIKAPKELGRQDLEAIAEELFDSVYGDDGKRTFDLLGWEAPKGTDYRRWEGAFKVKAPKLTAAELNGLILVLLLRDAVGNQAFDSAHGGLEATAKRLKIDTAAVRKQLAAAAPPAKKLAKAKTPRKAK